MRNTEVNNQGRIIDDLIPSHINVGVSVNQTRRCETCGAPSKGKYCSTPCYRLWQRSRPAEARFWTKVHKTPSCWIWTSTKTRFGHGLFHLGSRGDSPTYAHRFSWQLANGPIPHGLQVLHNCPGGDNASCVNPAHLFLGTQADNLKDAAKKERFHVPRPNHPRRTLSETDVERIKMMRATGLTLVEIGKQFGVTKACISQIVNGKRRVYTAPQLQTHSQKRAS